MTLDSRSLLLKAQGLHVKVGIGQSADEEKIESSASEAERSGMAEVTFYSDAISLVGDLRSGKIDAAVRGDLGSNPSMKAVRDIFGISKVLRAALMEPLGGTMFVLAPVGIDEGWSLSEKIKLAELSAGLVRTLGENPAIAFLSGGRNSDLRQNG